MSKRYCRFCDRLFKSQAGLLMHWFKSKYHKKNTPYYHKKPGTIPTKSNTTNVFLDKFIEKGNQKK